MIRASLSTMLALALMAFACCTDSLARDEFAKPVRLKADGKVIDTGEFWGHSSPCVEDVDGDGLDDLVVGDFSGTFHLYKNVGERGKPTYNDAGLIRAGGEVAKVRIYCCIGCQARFADLDGDGIRDLVSNSYDPGYCYLFRGLPGHKFAARKEVIDKSGVPVRRAPVQQQDYQSFGSFFTPVDWDADGDFDMLIGAFDGHLYLRINEGDAKKASFATENLPVEAGGAALKVERHCCPVVADWDGDGLWDIVAGSEDGSVTWFRNQGTKQAPKFDDGVTLVEKSPFDGYDLLQWSDDEIVPGIRSQVDVVDYNNDGKLDLLVGDFSTAYEPKKVLSDAEKKQLEQLVAEREKISRAFAEKMKALRESFQKRYPGDAAYSDEADKTWTKEYQELKKGPEYKKMVEDEAAWVRQVRPFLAETRGEGDRSFDLALSHGYVWLFLRKEQNSAG